MNTILTKDWINWIRENIKRNSDKGMMVDELLSINIEPQIIHKLIYGDLKIELKDESLSKLKSQIRDNINEKTLFNQLLREGYHPSLIQNKINQIKIDNITFHNISKIKLTKAYKYPSDLVDLYIIDNFLDDFMCQNIIQLIKQNNQMSNITNDNEPDKYYRTSNTSHLDISNPIVKELDKQICNYIGIHNDRSEQTQGQYYKIGNEFKKHTDWFDPTNYKEWHTYAEHMGQRTWTFMIYLNDVARGGSTYFHEIDFNSQAIKGRAVVWNNIYPDGSVNKNTLHSGQPVLDGEKYIITKWFRSRGKLNYPFLLS